MGGCVTSTPKTMEQQTFETPSNSSSVTVENLEESGGSVLTPSNIETFLDDVRDSISHRQRSIMDISINEEHCIDLVRNVIMAMTKDIVKPSQLAPFAQEIEEEFRVSYSLWIQALIKYLDATFGERMAGIIGNAKDVQDCISMLHDLIREETKTEKMKRISHHQILTLKEKHEKIYKHSFKIEILLAETKDHIIQRMLEIITRSPTILACLEKMSDMVDDFAAKYVKNDPSFHGIPVGELNRLKRELKPGFRVQYQRFTDHYTETIRKQMLSNQVEIISLSTDPENCLMRMKDAIDSFDNPFDLKDLKNELEPIFLGTYQNLKQFHLRELTSSTRERVLKDRDLIVVSSKSIEECMNTMSASVDKYALEMVQQDVFLKAMPVGECNKLKRELKPIFKSRFLARKQDVILDLKKAKLDELIYATQAAVLHQMDEIIRNSATVNDCLSRVEEEVDLFAHNYVQESKFFTSMPRKKLRKLKEKLRANFTDIYQTPKPLRMQAALVKEAYCTAIYTNTTEYSEGIRSKRHASSKMKVSLETSAFNILNGSSCTSATGETDHELYYASRLPMKQVVQKHRHSMSMSSFDEIQRTLGKIGDPSETSWTSKEQKVSRLRRDILDDTESETLGELHIPLGPAYFWESKLVDKGPTFRKSEAALFSSNPNIEDLEFLDDSENLVSAAGTVTLSDTDSFPESERQRMIRQISAPHALLNLFHSMPDVKPKYTTMPNRSPTLTSTAYSDISLLSDASQSFNLGAKYRGSIDEADEEDEAGMKVSIPDGSISPVMKPMKRMRNYPQGAQKYSKSIPRSRSVDYISSAISSSRSMSQFISPYVPPSPPASSVNVS